MSQMVKVHVTYDKTKRIISHQKGSEVQALHHVFLKVFSDVLSDQVAPANVTFQRYDDSFSDYVELNNDEKFDDDIKLLALVSNQDKQVWKNFISKKDRPKLDKQLSKHDLKVTSTVATRIHQSSACVLSVSSGHSLRVK